MEEMASEIARLKKELDDLKKKEKPKYKVSPKGALSIYGYGKFPVTQYINVWEDILSQKEDILAFIEQNRDKFSTKEGSPDKKS